MEKLRFRSLAAVSLFALGVGCGQQAPSSGPASEPVGHASQALSTGLVISGVFGGGGGSTGSPSYNSDYVELFNRGTTALPLTGMSLQYAVASKLAAPDAGPSTWNVIPLPSGVTIEPGHYYLVRVYAGTAGAALPTPDYDPAGSETGMLAQYGTSSGIVALVADATPIDCGTDGGSCTGTNIVDLMAWGDTCPCGSSARPTVYEGSGPAPAGVNTSGFFRKDGGCTETDDNKNDFELLAYSASIVPRNSATPAHVCSLDGGVSDAAVDVAVDAPADAPADAPVDDSGTTDGGADAADTGTAPEDTGTAPEDTGTAPEDTGTAPEDTGTAAADTGTENTTPVAEDDSGCGCRVAGESHSSTMAGAFAALAIAGVIARRRRR